MNDEDWEEFFDDFCQFCPLKDVCEIQPEELEDSDCLHMGIPIRVPSWEWKKE